MGAGMEKVAIAQGGSSKGRYLSSEDIDAYNRGWASFMVTILREQMAKLKVPDTQALSQSIKELIQTGDVTTIEHRFLRYGIYVASGVGKGFRPGNGGNLDFMGDKYRVANGSRYSSRQVGAGLSEHAMLSPKYAHKTIIHGKNKGKEAALTSGNRRQPEDFFFKKYYYSLHRLNEENNAFWGKAYQGMTSSFLETLFASLDDDKRNPLKMETAIRSNHF